MMRKKNKRYEERRQEALTRQEEYDSLSIEQRIARAKSRRGNSRKELAGLKREIVV